MFESLGEKQRRTAMRGAFRAAASNVRAGAVKELRSSGLRSNRDVEKGIRVVVYKKALGFKVTVGTKKRRVNYGSKTGRELTEARRKERLRIVPLWAEGGTAERRTTRSGSFCGISWKRKGKGDAPERCPHSGSWRKPRERHYRRHRKTCRGKWSAMSKKQL